MKSNITINGIRFLKHGVKDVAGKYYPAALSRCILIDGRDAVTIYARDLLKGLPAGLNPTNESDMRTDYSENDRARFYAGTPEFDLLATIAHR